MNILLDAHVLLWHLKDDSRLKTRFPILYRRAAFCFLTKGGSMKRFVTVLASVLLIVSSAFAGTAGNVNNDTTVDLKDVIAALQVCAGLTPAGISTGGDANNDGKIGLEEAIYVLQVVSQLRTGSTGGNGSTFTDSLGMKFVLIPAGTFTMGSPSTEPGRYSSEDPQHQVTLSSFYMQTTEVTQGQWKAVMGSNPSYFSTCGDNCPVEQVSWNDIQTFITALNSRGEGTYRLPTEAEWEYAARANSTTAFANGGITNTSCSPVDTNLDAMG